ncbi:hypothetical protein BU23DRAFT_18936 [Bimuria novae-zelandiae CBS 107.79]|uniref:Secreted protein n=1 Tax=Bimuria novae-zelandiae CBS 107.79 TaxID=1447943 RepID=A0A6A5ULB1_9PLEO|nr:hypothetical protein BU23DRAFT_18936 [Bimuria novae-zelandiae CBS 107.79]
MVFKVFPCRLLVVGPAMARPPAALTSGQCWPVLTLLSSVKYPAARYLQVPSRHHGEVRVVVVGKGNFSSTEVQHGELVHLSSWRARRNIRMSTAIARAFGKACPQ